MQKDYKIIDFNPLAVKGKKGLFLKRPIGEPIPQNTKWRCLCTNENVLTELPEQYCNSCGSKLRLQINKEETSKYWTLVVTTHFTKP